MRCGLKRNAWFKDFEKRSFSKDRTIEGRQVKIDLDPNVGKGRCRAPRSRDCFGMTLTEAMTAPYTGSLQFKSEGESHFGVIAGSRLL